MLGARVGQRAEVSTAAHLDPDLLILGQESFVADMASVGAATFANSRMALLPTEIGSRAFVGNAAVLPTGTLMGDGSLVGVSTVPPYEGVPAGSSWLGSPAMHLPRRQDSGSFSEDQTFRPPRKVVLHRLAVEFFRATLPASILGVSFYLFLLVLSGLANGRDLPVPALVSPAGRAGGRTCGHRVLRGREAQPDRPLPAPGGAAVEPVRATLGIRHRPIRGGGGTGWRRHAGRHPVPAPRASLVRCAHRPADLDRHDLPDRVRPDGDR